MDDILNFLPIYPDINDEYFNDEIYKKKEFNENKLDAYEEIQGNGQLLKHQKIISRFFSSNTLYDQILFYHSMGTGKTMTSIACIEQIKDEKSTFKGALILTKGTLLRQNYQKELIEKWAGGTKYKYTPKKRYKNRSRLSTQLIKDYYSFFNFQEFSNELSKMSDELIIKEYSNYIIVIDEIHNIRLHDKSEDKKMYYQFHRFLHLIHNSKVILMSGTPIKDKFEEIADVMNLILPLDKQLPTKNDFLNRYFNKTDYTIDNDIKYELKDDENLINELKSRFQGRVSYLRSIQSSVKHKFIGEENVKGLTNLIVYPVTMSNYQTKYYSEAYNKDDDSEEDSEEDESEYEANIGSSDSFDINSSSASLFVFPDGDYTNVGYNECISIEGSTYSLNRSSDLYKEIMKGKSDEDKLKNIGKFSAKYESIIRNILKAVRDPYNKKCIFIYSNSVTKGGIILFSTLLKLFSFKQATGNETTKDLRYILVTTENAKESQIAIQRFNQKDNVHGDYISIVLGSRLISEGFSLFHIQEEYILTPHWNYSETEQAIARGLRTGSHKFLLNDFETKYLKDNRTSEELSEIAKDLGIKSDKMDINEIIDKIIEHKNYIKQFPDEIVVNIYQYVSIPNNDKVPSVDIKHYKKSVIKDMNSKMIERIIKESAFDCALNYDRNKITGYDNERECEYKNCEYTCDNVINMIPKELDYSTDKLFYINSDENKKIKDKVQNIFKTNFFIDVNDIRKISEKENINNEYIFLFLKQIIDEKEIVYNKFGIPCYLYENNNIFYLVDDANTNNNFLSTYYTQILNIKSEQKTLSLIDVSYDIPSIVKSMFQTTDENEIIDILIKKLKPDIVEIILEQLILQINSKSNIINQIQKNIILNFLKSYFLKFDDIFISWLLFDIKKPDYNDLRCLKKDEDEWVDCTNNEINIFKEYINNIKDNEYKYFGYYILDDETKENKFYLVNMEQNLKLKKVEKVSLKKSKKSEKNKKDDEIDSRTINKGIYCGNITNKVELCEIILNKFKIEPENDDKWNTINELSSKEFNEKYKETKQLNKLTNISANDKKALYYWYKTDKTILCNTISKFLKENGLTMQFFNLKHYIKEEKEKKLDKKEKKEEKKEKKKAAPTNPMMLSSDLAGTESADGNYAAMMSVGVSKSSLMGDKSYSASALIWSTFDQFALSSGVTKMVIADGKLKALNSYSFTSAYLKGTLMGLMGYTWIKPHPTLGTFGYNLGAIMLMMQGTEMKYNTSFSTSVVVFWTKPYQYSQKLTFSPQVFVMSSPIAYNALTGGTSVSRTPGALLGTSIDYRISKRFGFNFGYKANIAFEPEFSLLHNFQIGSKMTF